MRRRKREVVRDLYGVPVVLRQTEATPQPIRPEPVLNCQSFADTTQGRIWKALQNENEKRSVRLPLGELQRILKNYVIYHRLRGSYKEHRAKGQTHQMKNIYKHAMWIAKMLHTIKAPNPKVVLAQI